ncbi:MAG TPA: hypothetical protein VF944_06105 [Candidatus Bathyarchaeia archaeon]
MATRPSPCPEEPCHIQDPIYMSIANIVAPLGFSNYCRLQAFTLQLPKKPNDQKPNLIAHLGKRICRKLAPSGGFMTRPEWQKKKKKMAGREGPKKGKNR